MFPLFVGFVCSVIAVFSLSFSSAGKGQFLTGKAKKLHSWGGGGGGGAEVGSGKDMASLSLGKLETSFSYYNV